MNDNAIKEDLKHYPPYKNALDEIAAKTAEAGYGMLFTHEQLKEWMDVKEPKTIEEYKKCEFAYMASLEKLKDELMVDYNIFLDSVPGEGYRVLIPDEQITIGVDKYTRKAQRLVLKSMISALDMPWIFLGGPMSGRPSGCLAHKSSPSFSWATW